MSHNDTPKPRAAERLLDESSICKHWMTTKVRTVAPSDSIGQARDLLKRHGINQLPVIAHGKLLGMVTDRDVRGSPRLHRSAAAAVADQRVQSVMSRPAIALGCHSTLLNAAEVMRRSRIGAVPILRGEILVGIVTRSDILDAFIGLANGRYYRNRKPLNRSSVRKSASQ